MPSESVISYQKGKQWSNIISLGFFCGVAQDTERYGLRSHSGPFDWLISDSLARLFFLIQNRFDGFMDYKNLLQYNNNCGYYYDKLNKLHFYHDFVPFKPLCVQYRKVKKKYQRRIKTFYEAISKPTLFIRYCASESEIVWINKNYQLIVNEIKKHNKENEILFVIDSNAVFDNKDINFFFVKKDTNDTVCRVPSSSNKSIKQFLESEIIPKETRNKNYAFSDNKKNIKRITKIKKKVLHKLDVIFWGLIYPDKTYIHKRQYDAEKQNEN